MNFFVTFVYNSDNYIEKNRISIQALFENDPEWFEGKKKVEKCRLCHYYLNNITASLRIPKVSDYLRTNILKRKPEPMLCKSGWKVQCACSQIITGNPSIQQMTRRGAERAESCTYCALLNSSFS